jgi:hypothetical protein
VVPSDEEPAFSWIHQNDLFQAPPQTEVKPLDDESNRRRPDVNSTMRVDSDLFFYVEVLENGSLQKQ